MLEEKANQILILHANIATLENQLKVKRGNTNNFSFKANDYLENDNNDNNDNERMKITSQKKDLDFIDKHIIRTIRGGK